MCVMRKGFWKMCELVLGWVTHGLDGGGQFDNFREPFAIEGATQWLQNGTIQRTGYKMGPSLL